ncbi:MAG TPA: chemotaxis protein CheB [Gemmatimonadaceae bacterium]|nr:chemotaxis protein CheB [Gemmatimonadaceae bacterium]
MKRSTGRSPDHASDQENGALGYEIVVVGTSWGGLAALRAIVAALPAGYTLPIAIVQHRHRDSDGLAKFLQSHTALNVCEVEDKQPIEGGKIFVAPANYHMLVERGHLALSVDAPVRFSRPSIDVALTSAAHAYGHRAVGVVLTGSNADGAEGLRIIADAGGMAVIQTPDTAEAPTMPQAAARAVPTARVFPLARIASFLATLPSVYDTERAS